MVHMDRHKFKPYLNSCELLTEFVVLKNELPGIAYNLDYEYSYIMLYYISVSHKDLYLMQESEETNLGFCKHL